MNNPQSFALHTGQILRSDIVIKQSRSGNIYRDKHIANAENYYRKAIWEALNEAPAGKTVLIDSNNLFTIRCAIKAAWDLGCVIFEDTGDVSFVRHPQFKKLLPVPDVLISDDQRYQSNNFVPVCPLIMDKEYQVFRPLIMKEDKRSWEAIRIHDVDIESVNRQFFTHHDLIEIIRKTIVLRQLNADDRVLHSSFFNETFNFIIYNLSSLAIARNHYDFSNTARGTKEEQKLLQTFVYCVDHGITRIYFSPSEIELMSKDVSVDLQGIPHLYTQNPPSTTKMHDIVEYFDPASVTTSFGNASDLILLESTTTKDTIDKYHPRRFSTATRDIEINFDRLTLSGHKTLPYHILKKDDVYWNLGETKKFKREFGEISISEIHRYIKNFMRDHAVSIVRNFVKEKIYLAVYDPAALTRAKELKDDMKIHFRGDLPMDIDWEYDLLDDIDLISGIDPARNSLPSEKMLLKYFLAKGESNGMV
jgi:hypothetical protein